MSNLIISKPQVEEIKMSYTICTPWELPETCSNVINRYCLYPIHKNDNKQASNVMNSSEFKSESITRHISLKSNQHILTVGHKELFKALEPFEIRCIYPYVTAGITVISFYKLNDAKNGIKLIQDRFHEFYDTCFVKPCLIHKKLNEKIFITISYHYELQQQHEKVNYMELLSTLDQIHTISVANISEQFVMVNVEFDDERIADKVLKEYQNVLVKQNVRLQSFKADNDEFTCSCHDQKVDLHYSQEPVPNFPSTPILDYNKSFNPPPLNHQNQSKSSYSSSFFSVDPFISSSKRKEEEQVVEKSIPSSSSTTSSSSSHHHSWKGSSKRESYDSIITIKSSSDSSSCTNTTGTTIVVDKKPSISSSDDDETNNSFNIENIINGRDTRTTFMIRNIPNKYTQKMLIDCINETHANTYDFLYLRIDFKNKCNVGYAFINFINVESVVSFYKDRVGKKWKLFNSDKKCSLSYANIQGKEALIRKFKNSQVMEEDDTYRPKLFYTQGLNKGKEQPFPKPDENIKHDLKQKSFNHHRHRYHHKQC